MKGTVESTMNASSSFATFVARSACRMRMFSSDRKVKMWRISRFVHSAKKRNAFFTP